MVRRKLFPQEFTEFMFFHSVSYFKKKIHIHSLSVWSPACVIIPSKNQNRLLPVQFVWLGADFDVTRPLKVRRFALRARGRPSWFQMYRVKPGDECQIHLGAPPLKSYLVEYVSPFKYSIYSFQSCVHCATNTAESNFGAHIFIILVVKEKFGLFRTIKSFSFAWLQVRG